MWFPGNAKFDAMANEAVTSATTLTINKIPTKNLINEVQKRIPRKPLGFQFQTTTA